MTQNDVRDAYCAVNESYCGTVPRASLFPHGPTGFTDMATCARTVWKALAGCQRQLLRAGGPAHAGRSRAAPTNPPVRTLAAVKPLRKDKKDDAAKEAQKEKRVVDDAGRHKPYGRTAWAPVDDVYFMRYYPRAVYGAADAINMLKGFQKLDFTPVKQPVYIDLKLDMKLEKKRRVESFVSTVHLPHPFRTEMNSVLVFTEDADQTRAAMEGGAAFAGGVELMQSILDEEISADYYVAVPAILPKLVPLKNKLRKKFPKGTRGSVSGDIAQMLALFQKGHEVLVENDCYVRTQIATLDMNAEQILNNLQRVLMDVCSHRPASMGPFIERAIIASQTSEALWFRSQDVLPEDK
uniref:Mitochondrial ribosomal protein L1 n=2 Tax=Gasterosteus aculeatus aculeatus TaxID=481459 RepID=A0AAQ4PED0_GASAC